MVEVQGFNGLFSAHHNLHVVSVIISNINYFLSPNLGLNLSRFCVLVAKRRYTLNPSKHCYEMGHVIV